MIVVAALAGYGTWLLYTGLALGWAGMGPSPRQPVVHAADGWPRVIEEVRLLAGPGGRSVASALVDAGRLAPPPLASAFAAAEAAWRSTADFDRAARTLTDALDDPIARSLCELLCVAHGGGAVDLDPRLSDLAHDAQLALIRDRELAVHRARVHAARALLIAGALAGVAAWSHP